MKVLVISQVVFSKTNNTGKTLLSYFRGFKEDEIAQLYFHSEMPKDDSVCTRYYRFNDADAIKSIFNRKITGKTLSPSAIKSEISTLRTDDRVKRKAYVIGARHSPIVLLLRDLVWRLSNWNNDRLWGWIDNYNPDVIFFLSGDAGFSYRICKCVSERRGIPIVPVCVDDYYLNNRNHGRRLANFQHRLFMKKVRQCFSKADSILTICDKMNKEYSLLFKKKCHTLHTSAQNRHISIDNKASQISYIGNVGYNRFKQLIKMADALREIDDNKIPHTIDVYSGSIDSEYIVPLTNTPGIRFHGKISSDEVLSVMSESICVIHTESFDPIYRNLTRYSVSTKIAESLMYGPCIIAYGPDDIASIKYLEENNAAYVITDSEKLKDGLEEILTDESLRITIVENARKLAFKNHNESVNPKKVRSWLQSAISQGIDNNNLIIDN